MTKGDRDKTWKQATEKKITIIKSQSLMIRLISYQRWRAKRVFLESVGDRNRGGKPRFWGVFEHLTINDY